MLRTILIIGTGSFIGGVLRFLISRLVQNNVISSFPYGTLVVNILGCLILGVLLGLAEKGNVLSNEWRLFLAIGLCGGFTTFSTFAGENFAMLRDGNYFFFALYASASVLLGLLAVFAGHFTIKMI